MFDLQIISHCTATGDALWSSWPAFTVGKYLHTHAGAVII